MSSVDQIKLSLKLHQFPHLIERLPNKYNKSCQISKEMRSKILLSQSDIDEFESLLTVLIPEQIPKAVIEDYVGVSDYLKKFEGGGKIKVIYSSVMGFDISKSILFANVAENGGKIIETQHGGGYGSALYAAHEFIQKEHSDLYLSWGWSDSLPNVLPMSTGSKFHFVKKICNMNNENGYILLIENGYPRYNCNILMNNPDGPHYLKNISSQYDFCSSLSQTATFLLKIRPYKYDWGWDRRQRWEDKFPNISTDSKGKSFYEQLKESRLAIVTSNQTTLLECLVANIPTILFWNPDIEKLRPSAQPYFDKLHEVGILHYTPQSAAKLVNEICEDPKKWWLQPKIQQAKDEFCHQFARTSDDWMNQLAVVLKSQLALAKKEMKERRKK